SVALLKSGGWDARTDISYREMTNYTKLPSYRYRVYELCVGLLDDQLIAADLVEDVRVHFVHWLDRGEQFENLGYRTFGDDLAAGQRSYQIYLSVPELVRHVGLSHS